MALILISEDDRKENARAKTDFFKLSATYLAANVLHRSVAPLLPFIGNFGKVLTDSTPERGSTFTLFWELWKSVDKFYTLPFIGNSGKVHSSKRGSTFTLYQEVLTNSKDLYF